jgi:hypothetical protein
LKKESAVKTHTNLNRMTALVLALVVAALLPSNTAMAHCDSMDGPVVKDAQRALAEKSVVPVLKWLRAEDEAAVRTAFDAAMKVRGESDAAKDLADRYFFETLVRLHRAGEGEGFTGLKLAGSTDPAIAATDRALDDGNIDQLADKYAVAVRDAIKHRFSEAHEKRRAASRSVAQGREYVEAYVQLTHFVESVDHLAASGASHKHRESGEVER